MMNNPRLSILIVSPMSVDISIAAGIEYGNKKRQKKRECAMRCNLIGCEISPTCRRVSATQREFDSVFTGAIHLCTNCMADSDLVQVDTTL